MNQLEITRVCQNDKHDKCEMASLHVFGFVQCQCHCHSNRKSPALAFAMTYELKLKMLQRKQKSKFILTGPRT